MKWESLNNAVIIIYWDTSFMLQSVGATEGIISSNGWHNSTEMEDEVVIYF